MGDAHSLAMETPSEDASCLEANLVGQALQYVSTGTYTEDASCLEADLVGQALQYVSTGTYTGLPDQIVGFAH